MSKFNLSAEEFDVKKEKPKQKQDAASVSAAKPSVKSHVKSSGSVLRSIRFSEENVKYLVNESRLRGLSVTAFVNQIVEQYKSDPANVNYKNFENEAWW